jgi:hypothetical protein
MVNETSNSGWSGAAILIIIIIVLIIIGLIWWSTQNNTRVVYRTVENGQRYVNGERVYTQM